MRQPRHREKRDYFSDKPQNANGGKHPSPRPQQKGMDYFEEGQKDDKRPRRRKAA